MDTPRSALAIIDELDAVLSLVGSVDEADWKSPTRCPPWDVRQLVAHVALPARALSNGLSALRTGREVSAGGEPLAEDLPAGSVLHALRQRRDEVEGAVGLLTPSELEAVLPRPAEGGPVLPTATLLQLALVEIGIHRSDLAAALGKPDDLGIDVVKAVSAVVPTWLLMSAAVAPLPPGQLSYQLTGGELAIGFSYVPESGWHREAVGGAVDCEVSGSESDLALFLLGRRGAGHASITSTAPDLLGAFKTYLPGP